MDDIAWDMTCASKKYSIGEYRHPYNDSPRTMDFQLQKELNQDAEISRKSHISKWYSEKEVQPRDIDLTVVECILGKKMVESITSEIIFAPCSKDWYGKYASWHYFVENHNDNFVFESKENYVEHLSMFILSVAFRKSVSEIFCEMSYGYGSIFHMAFFSKYAITSMYGFVHMGKKYYIDYEQLGQILKTFYTCLYMIDTDKNIVLPTELIWELVFAIVNESMIPWEGDLDDPYHDIDDQNERLDLTSIELEAEQMIGNDIYLKVITEKRDNKIHKINYSGINGNGQIFSNSKTD